MFDEVFAQAKHVIAKHAVLIAEGQLRYDDFINGWRLTAKRMRSADEAIEEYARRLTIRWPSESPGPELRARAAARLEAVHARPLRGLDRVPHERRGSRAHARRSLVRPRHARAARPARRASSATTASSSTTPSTSSRALSSARECGGGACTSSVAGGRGRACSRFRDTPEVRPWRLVGAHPCAPTAPGAAARTPTARFFPAKTPNEAHASSTERPRRRSCVRARACAHRGPFRGVCRQGCAARAAGTVFRRLRTGPLCAHARAEPPNGRRLSRSRRVG